MSRHIAEEALRFLNGGVGVADIARTEVVVNRLLLRD
jgi:hypothetical protein